MARRFAALSAMVDLSLHRKLTDVHALAGDQTKWCRIGFHIEVATQNDRYGMPTIVRDAMQFGEQHLHLG